MTFEPDEPIDPDEKPPTMGDRILAERNARRWSQMEVCTLACLTPSRLSEYENNHKRPGLAVLGRLASVFSKPIDYFVNGDKQ